MATAEAPPGGLYTGDAAAPATNDPPGTLHTGAPAAKRGGMFSGRKKEGAVAAGGRGEGVAVNAGARTGLLISQLLTAIAFLIVLGGLSSLQQRANNLGLLLPQQQAIYAEIFQSGNQVPYPNNGPWQFGLQWWTLMFEIFIFVMILVLIAMPRHLLRLKHTAMAFLVYVFVLTTLQINSLLFFNRSPVSRALYGSSRIKASLAGSIMGAVCNAFSIIFLGLLRNEFHHGIGGRRVSHDAMGPAAV